MLHTRLSRITLNAAFFAALAAMSACTTVENAYDSASTSMGDMFGSKEYQQAPTKVEVKSPAAAPVQDVKAQEITDSKPVELGSMSDKPMMGTDMAAPAAQDPAQPITPITPQTNAPMEQAQAEPAPVLTPAGADAAAPVATTTSAPATAPVASNTVALLTIRFNQPHVYYEDALGQAVSAAEKTKSDVMYEVLSTIPDLTSLPPEQQAKLSARAKDNLRNVVVKMQQQGVAPDRIRIAEQTLKIRSQEVRVFVR